MSDESESDVMAMAHACLLACTASIFSSCIEADMARHRRSPRRVHLVVLAQDVWIDRIVDCLKPTHLPPDWHMQDVMACLARALTEKPFTVVRWQNWRYESDAPAGAWPGLPCTGIYYRLV